MLRTAQQLRNVITIYHSPASKASQELVKKVARVTADPSSHRFDVNIEEGNPTLDQLNTLKKYTPLLANITDPKDLPRPTLVSWLDGKVAVNNEIRANAILNHADDAKDDD